MKAFRLLPLLLLAGCQALSRGALDGAGAGLSGGAPPPAAGGGFDGWDAAAYTGASILAYVLGSLGKGFIRSKMEEKDKA